MPFSDSYSPSRTHEALGPDFFDPVAAAAFPKHILRWRNQRWAERTGLENLTNEEWTDHFGHFQPLQGNMPQPLALRYHGHQFRSYNPELGDGRGFLFGQLFDDQHRLLDLATKGSGQTPWSRTADGRLTLKGGVREILATEMLEALGVNTSKSFSLIETGEELWRGDEPSPTRSSVLVRLSHSHIRIGTFQRLLYLDEHANIEKLMNHAVRHYLPEAERPETGARATAFLQAVCDRVALMGARWMLAGFVHGVLNTDNINITGESFDYGPWRFTPVLDPAFTAAYFDQQGLYAFGRQPDTLLWNLTRLAECLLPLTEQAALMQVLESFAESFRLRFAEALCDRLGLVWSGDEAGQQLAGAVWRFLAESRMPFERFFFDWHGGISAMDSAALSPSNSVYSADSFAPVFESLARHTPQSGARDHEYFAGREPCTMLIDEVEAIWAPISAKDDWKLFENKISAIAQMRAAYSR